MHLPVLGTTASLGADILVADTGILSCAAMLQLNLAFPTYTQQKPTPDERAGFLVPTLAFMGDSLIYRSSKAPGKKQKALKSVKPSICISYEKDALRVWTNPLNVVETNAWLPLYPTATKLVAVASQKHRHHFACSCSLKPGVNGVAQYKVAMVAS